MTRVARLLHLDDGEFPALRAQIEAEPMPRVGVPATTRRPLRIDEQARSIAALAEMRAEAPVAFFAAINADPLELTDWSKQLAWTWAYADAAIAVRVKDAKAELGSDRNAAGALFAPLFSELADFAAEIDNDRGALYGHINAERVLLAELAPFAAKAGC